MAFILAQRIIFFRFRFFFFSPPNSYSHAYNWILFMPIPTKRNCCLDRFPYSYCTGSKREKLCVRKNRIVLRLSDWSTDCTMHEQGLYHDTNSQQSTTVKLQPSRNYSFKCTNIKWRNKLFTRQSVKSKKKQIKSRICTDTPIVYTVKFTGSRYVGVLSIIVRGFDDILWDYHLGSPESMLVNVRDRRFLISDIVS